MQSASVSQRPTKARCRSTSRRSSSSIDSRTQRRRSVETWSFRLRRGVQLAADVADPIDQGPLDVHVDVFELDRELEPALVDRQTDFREPLDDLPALVGRQQTDLGEHLGVGDRARRCRARASRRSKLMLSVNASTRGSVGPSNVPPQAFFDMSSTSTTEADLFLTCRKDTRQPSLVHARPPAASEAYNPGFRAHGLYKAFSLNGLGRGVNAAGRRRSS